MSPSTPQAPEVRHASMPYMPALDGIRAFAVVAVLLYHADTALKGGFLGVEMFFALSGFLITSLLYSEWQRNGRIDIGAFWVRRARRLLPALLVMIVGTLLFAAIVLPSEVGDLYDDTVAALAYVMNWHLVASQQSYFDATLRPSLFQNLWSLAVEEQFYIVWPLLFVLGMRLLRVRALFIALMAGALGSALLMANLYDPGVDPSRVYYGTDTRASALLLGAALALVWSPWNKQASRRTGTLLDIGGLAALGALGAAAWSMVDYMPFLYRGGFALTTVLTLVVVLAATYPGARIVPGLLSWQPLSWIGQRSYGIYLWHWPVFQVTRPYMDVQLEGLPLAMLRFAVVLALAEVSYRLVEMPVRKGALQRVWQTLQVKRRASRVWYRAPHWARHSLAYTTVLSTVACSLQTNTGSVGTTPSVVAANPTLAMPTLAATAAPSATVVPSVTTEPSTTPTDEPPTVTPSPEPTATPQPIDPALAAELQRILDTLVADGFIPGASVAVYLPGQQVWLGTSGIASRETGQALLPDTEMRIASISKTFTSVVILQLAEEGKVSLDAPMSTYLPDLVPSGNEITVRNLLQHTSGLFDFLEDRSFVNQAYRDPQRVWQPRELVEYAVARPSLFRPSTPGAWDYSSTNFVILGMIAEQVTGNTLAQEMRARIFDPLDLSHTYFAPDEAIPNQSNGYSNDINQTNVGMSFGFATANVVSVPENVNRFMRAIFDGELLTPESVAEMTTFVDGKGQYNMPALEYGLGLMRNQLPVGPGPDGQPRSAEITTVMGHIGGFGGFRSAAWYAPATGATIVLGENQAATNPNILATSLFDAVLSAQGK